MRPNARARSTRRLTATERARADPTFQLTRMYRVGELDACERARSDLWACVAAKRAAREGREVALDRSDREREARTGYWRALAPGRAGTEWRALFGGNVPSEKETSDAIEAWTRARESSTGDGATG